MVRIRRKDVQSDHAQPPVPVVEDEVVGPVKLMGLAHSHCRWPLAMHDGERTFCGQTKAGEGAYCAGHQAIATTPFRPNQAKTGNQLVRQLRRYAA